MGYYADGRRINPPGVKSFAEVRHPALFFPFACKILLFPLLARYCDGYSAPRRNVVDFPNQVLEMSRLNEAAMVSDEAVAGGEAVVADEGGSAEAPAAVTAGDS